MTGEDMLEALIVKAVQVRQWPRERAEAEAWAWLQKEAGVAVRWPEMDIEQRWCAEAALERHAAPKVAKKSKRTKELPLPEYLVKAKQATGDFLWAHRNDPPDPAQLQWVSALAVELESIETPGLNFDLHQVA